MTLVGIFTGARNGLFSFGVGAMFIGGWLVLRQPPPPSGKGGSSNINFGK